MRSFFAGLLYLCFGLPLALSALLLVSVRPWVLDRDFYKRVVGDEALYTAIKAADLGREAGEISLGGSSFDRPSLAAAVQKNLPVAELKELGSRSVDAVLDAAEGRRVPATIDLKPIKQVLVARSPQIARDYASVLPTRPALPAPGDLSFRNEALPVQTMATLADRALRTAVAGIPETGTVSPPRTREGRMAGFVSQASLDRAATISTALSVILLGGLAWLGGRNAGARLAKAGRFILLPSIVVLALGLVLYLPGASILGRLVPAQVHLALGGSSQALLGYIAHVFGLVSRGFMITGLVGASIGGGLVSLRRVFDPREL
jgi:hypothetical protein